MNEKLEVSVTAERTKHGNAICDCCHGIDHCAMIRYPRTKYHDGHTLSSKWHELWMCTTCATQWMDAIASALVVEGNSDQ